MRLLPRLRQLVASIIIGCCVGSCSMIAPVHAASAGGLQPTPPYVNLGSVDAVQALLERVNPGSSSHFTLVLADTCAAGTSPPGFSLHDEGDKVKVVAYGVGHYMRKYCRMVVGWRRGGGSSTFIPNKWPKVGSVVIKRRNTPWSYIMNVCTHSYSLVWYSWGDWQELIDWMSLSGVNVFLGMTGQVRLPPSTCKRIASWCLMHTDAAAYFPVL